MLTRAQGLGTSQSASELRSRAESAAVSGGANKTVIVSGGSRGLGAELVSGFLERGFGVATFSRARSEFIDSVVRRRRRQRDFHWSAIEGADFEALRGFVNEVADRFGRIDVLVNNLGRGIEGVLPTMRTNDIIEAIDVNLTAPLVMSQACSRVMLRQRAGCIVNVSSTNAIRGVAGVAVYSATKAGLDGFTRSLARELGPRNIRVNSVAPGYFESDMVKGITQEQKQRMMRRTPLGRLATVQDVANMIFFLASHQASFITGQTIVIDGGLTC
jgi:3-oxoacyl-[acyl-carrier protein] reductase